MGIVSFLATTSYLDPLKDKVASPDVVSNMNIEP